MKRIVFVLLIILALIKYGNSFNRGEIREQVRDGIRDTSADTTRQKYSNDRLNLKIEFAHIDIIKKSRCLQSTTYYHLYIDTETYILPSNLLEVDRVSVYYSTGYYRVIDRFTLYGLDSFNKGWQQFASGQPERYYVRGNIIGIVPPANSTYAGASRLAIDYIVKPSSFTSDTDVPFNDYKHLYPYHELIVLKVIEQIKREERLYAESSMYEQKYFNLLRIMVSEVDRKEGFFPEFDMKFK